MCNQVEVTPKVCQPLKMLLMMWALTVISAPFPFSYVLHSRLRFRTLLQGVAQLLRLLDEVELVAEITDN